ncbi:MAG: hypothetical protein ACTHJ7_01645, partial [Candidatus Nitrosocosmicus sp.]
MTIKYSIISIGIFILLLLFANISNANSINIFAQNSTNSTLTLTNSKTSSGLKITYPEKGSVVPINSNSPFIIKGTSQDNAVDNCKVSVIINNVKPYQPAQSLNSNGKEDYSNWQYVLSKNYTQLIEGDNKITAKSYCLNNPQSKYYSVNVTGSNLSPDQLKSYNSSSVQQTSSSLVAPTPVSNIHPISLEIQQIKASSPSQFSLPVNNNINQNFNNTTPAVSNANISDSTASFGLNN